jgi:hypothetical protein
LSRSGLRGSTPASLLKRRGRLEREGLLQVGPDLVLPVVEITDEIVDAFGLLPAIALDQAGELAAKTERTLHLLVQVRPLRLARIGLRRRALAPTHTR